MAGYYCTFCTTVQGSTHAFGTTDGKKQADVVGKTKEINQLMPSQSIIILAPVQFIYFLLIFNLLLIVSLIPFTTPITISNVNKMFLFTHSDLAGFLSEGSHCSGSLKM